MNSPAQKIKERLSIEEIVSSYIKLEKAGANWKARCPFHNEKTPSFFISPERGSYYCFGCGASGDIFTFVEEFEGLDFKGALKLLADRAGVILESYNKKEESEKDRIYQAMEAATIYFESYLGSEEGVTEYLTKRGLTEESLSKFRVGYARAQWRELYDHMAQKGWGVRELEKAGLIKVNEGKIYDRFRGRIMFPIMDSSGRVIAFSGRIFPDDGKSSKYLNSPDTPIFNKHLILFGIDKAKDSIRKNNFSILVEGQMDLILSHQTGYKNTIATSGTALSDTTLSKDNVVSNLGVVRRLSPNIVLAYDADKAGLNATARAGRIALSLGMDVKIAALPEGLDPADLILKEGATAWKNAIKNSKHIIEFILERVLKDFGKETRKAGREIKEKVLPFVDALESSIEKMHFIKKISDISGISEDALADDLKKIAQSTIAENINIEAGRREVEHRKDNILRKLMGVIFWQNNLKERNIDLDTTLSELGRILQISKEEVLGTMKERGEDLIFEAEVFYGGKSNLEKDLAEMLNNLEEELLKEELDNKMRELHQVEEAKDFDQSAVILKECKVLNDRIQAIKNKRK
jgi:DNA primase